MGTRRWLLVVGVSFVACASETTPAADAARRADPSVTLMAADAPRVCRFCKASAPGDSPALTQAACPTPAAPLDAVQRARFRVDEVMNVMNGPFSQALTWGTVTDDGIGLAKPASETRIEGDVTLGDFVYHDCFDNVSARATVRFATADGQLAATVHGTLALSPDALGWPAGATPELSLTAIDDLSTARGTLDLGADPNKLELGELLFGVTRAANGARGFVRVRRNEFPNRVAFDAANAPTDVLSARVIHEVAMGVFPLDRCNGGGAPYDADAASPALAGGRWGDVLAAAWARLGSPHMVDAQWQVSGATTSVHIELGAQPRSVCAGASTAGFTMSGRVRSADGVVDQPLTRGQIMTEPYTRTLSRLSLDAPNGMVEVNLPAAADVKSSGSAIREDAQHFVVDTLVWPRSPR